MKDNCWNQIGVWGDLSCPRLETDIHCHNCSVYSQAGRALLERPEPKGYTERWTALVASPNDQPQGQLKNNRHTRLSVNIFRLNQEWLALPANIFDQVISPSPVHALPHCQTPLLRGVVNVRGQLLPCVSLHKLLGITTFKFATAGAWPNTVAPTPEAERLSLSPAKSSRQTNLELGMQGGYPRLAVIQQAQETWAFEVSEFYGLHFCQAERLHNAPTLSNQTLASFTQAIFPWRKQNVSYLDAEQLFSTLRKRAL